MNIQLKSLQEQLETEFIFYQSDFYMDTFKTNYVYGYDSFADLMSKGKK